MGGSSLLDLTNHNTSGQLNCSRNLSVPATFIAQLHHGQVSFLPIATM